MNDLLFKILNPFKFKRAVKRYTAKRIIAGTWSQNDVDELGAEFWLVRCGDYGWSVGEPIEGTDKIRIYGEV